VASVVLAHVCIDRRIRPRGNESKTGFAELRGELGWNHLRENYRVGLNIQAAAPTGTRPKGEFLLEPQIGNGKHWELGAGLKGLWTMWRSEDEDKHFDFIVEADVTHLFKAKQRRTFDLKGKPNSRYMLAQKLESTTGKTNTVDGSTVQFANEYSPVANFSTRDCKVSIGAQGDVVAMFNYTSRGFSWDLGYNFWGMSSEKIDVSCDADSSCPTSLPFTDNTWALKGDASIAGQSAGQGNPTVLLAATESKATIHGGTNALGGATGGAILANSFIDSATAALTGGGTAVNVFDSNPTAAINTSSTPLFLSATDLDVDGAAIRGISHKVFTHFSYSWTDRERWLPYIGAGVSGEFGSKSSNSNDCPTTTTTTTTSDCKGNRFALSQWAVFLKGGVSFH